MMTPAHTPKRKLIEVSLPLEAINRESAHEKSVPRKGHPATLHLWWARRPLAAARAILFAQLVDDPSSHPEQFPTEDAQRVERERLHVLIERLCIWENTQDHALLALAHAEILRSTEGSPPPIIDPFVGGGTIPLEAHRLGLETHASDLNPVAVLINRALIELPPKFRDQPPVYPGLANTRAEWRGAEGLAADVRAYGQWLRDEVERRIGHHYPSARLPDGTEATTIAWIWARTIRCPNPACGIEMPLVRSWWLSTKKGRTTFVIPHLVSDMKRLGGLKVEFSIGHDQRAAPSADAGTVSGRTGALCIACGGTTPVSYLRSEGMAGRIGHVLMSVVAEGKRQRVYLAPTPEQESAAEVDPPSDSVQGEMADNPRWFSPPMYGFTNFTDLFSNRQLRTLTLVADLVPEARDRVAMDAERGGGSAGLCSTDYAVAVATYLGFLSSKLADWQSTICSWIPQIEGVTHTFGRQAIPMVWDYAETNPLSHSVGNLMSHLEWIAAGVEALPANIAPSFVNQGDASSRDLGVGVLATDPPYYDNIGYADLSDLLYVWLRRSLGRIHPDLLSTMLVPKSEELVADPVRHGSKDAARAFFEDGFRKFFANARLTARPDYPITVYYAFKQSESSKNGKFSSGWETLLEGMVDSGWTITATWPLRSERSGRMIAIGTNALASSIVLSLRPRSENAPTTDLRGFIAALESELPLALRTLQQGRIAPVDLPQAAIGPGMTVFSRYRGVLESDGKKMTVRSALMRINEILDQVLNEQESDFDTTTRFAVAWYRQHGYGAGKFGDADNLARARNTSVDLLDRDGILTSRAGNVQLTRPSDLSWDYDVNKDSHTSTWEALHHLIKFLERDGIGPAGDFLQAALGRSDGAVDADLVKELAHLLFRIAEGNGATKDALSFNAVVTSWPETVDVARTPTGQDLQGALDFDEES